MNPVDHPHVRCFALQVFSIFLTHSLLYREEVTTSISEKHLPSPATQYLDKRQVLSQLGVLGYFEVHKKARRTKRCQHVDGRRSKSCIAGRLCVATMQAKLSLRSRATSFSSDGRVFGCWNGKEQEYCRIGFGFVLPSRCGLYVPFIPAIHHPENHTLRVGFHESSD